MRVWESDTLDFFPSQGPQAPVSYQEIPKFLEEEIWGCILTIMGASFAHIRQEFGLTASISRCEVNPHKPLLRGTPFMVKTKLQACFMSVHIHQELVVDGCTVISALIIIVFAKPDGKSARISSELAAKF
jgi:hypothetical protein